MMKQLRWWRDLEDGERLALLMWLLAAPLYVGFVIVCLAILGMGLYVLALLAGAVGLL